MRRRLTPRVMLIRRLPQPSTSRIRHLHLRLDRNAERRDGPTRLAGELHSGSESRIRDRTGRSHPSPSPSFNFDASVEEIFMSLTCGATLVLRDGEVPKAPAEFLQECREKKLTVLDLPTSYWHELIPSELKMEQVRKRACPRHCLDWTSGGKPSS